MDWVLPTDEILALAETEASKELNVDSPKAAADRGVEHHLPSQLRKLAAHLRQAF